MSKESYVRGFCKAAEEAGVNPNELFEFITKSAKIKEIQLAGSMFDPRRVPTANKVLQTAAHMSKYLPLAAKTKSPIAALALLPAAIGSRTTSEPPQPAQGIKPGITPIVR